MNGRVGRNLICLLALILTTTGLFAQAGARGGGRATPTHSITIESNVQGAQVVINGSVVGTAPYSAQLTEGSYAFVVRAPGHFDWSDSITVNSSRTIRAQLRQILHTLIVQSNVPQARVLIDGTDVGGIVHRSQLAPGRYDLIVRSPGYVDFVQTVELGSDQTVNAQLRPATARVAISIPSEILDRTVNNAAGQVQVFVDNAQMSGTTIEVPAGRRTIRVRSGGLSAEVTMDFTAGAQYTLTPFFTVNVR